ncbi:hypothetical protein BABAYKA_00300 [Brevundimonas phage vB_BpoS-Babayka]|uniref:Uncharacterized protein n=1 Tax=Brevundimonas phage vB_BpoS-Babayka TaxID=2948596 RepID=A0A9E7MUB2_9CAUD|nr:hypothetical protein BABAYKA_00300 [Brevundimonas phage vB_BpoS-Babayka]
MALKRWTGSAHADVGGVRRWTGTEWKLCDFVRRWSGSAWVDVWRGITAGIGGYFNPVSTGMNNYYDDGRFSVYVQPSGTPTPTSYQWGFTDYGGGLTMIGVSTGNQLRLQGPGYSQDNFPQQFQVDIWCDVTINGTVYRTQPFTAYYQTGFM